MTFDLAKLGIVVESQQAKRAASDLDKLTKSGARAERGTKRFTSATKRLESQLQRSLSPLTQFRTLLAGAGVAVGAREVIRLADSYSLLRGQIGLVTDSLEEQAEAQQALFDIAQLTGTALDANVSLFTRISRSREELGRSSAELLQFTEQIQKLTAVGNVSAQSATAGIFQLSQSLGKGVLDGDELKSILENIPEVARVIAQEFGVATGALKDMGAAGELTASRVITGVLNAAEQTDAAFAGLPDTVGRSMVRLSNAVLVAIGELDTELGASSGLARGITVLSENLDIVGDAAIALALVLTARLGGAVAAVTQQTVANTVASIANAKALTVRTAAEQRAAAVGVAMARSLEIGTARTNLQTAALARATVAQQAHTAAMARASVVARATTGAMDLLRKSMALLGGPAGLLILGAGALATWGTRAEEAAVSADSLSSSVGALSSNLDKLNKAQLEGRAIKIEADLEGLRELERLEKARFETLNKQARFAKDLEKHTRQTVLARAALADATERVSVAEEALVDIGDRLSRGAPATVAAINTVTEAVEKQTQAATVLADAHVEAYRKASAAAEQVAADQAEEQRAAGERAADAFQRPFINAMENIQRGFGNTFTEIFRHGEIRFETFTDLIRDMFARLAGEIAALLIFRPQVISAGLGMFGSGAAGAAGGAGTAAGAGGLGGLLAGGQGLGLGATLGLTAGAGLLGTYASGGFGSTAGMAGGLAGAGLGAYGGLLLGSATALGPLGIPLGALAGSFLGGGLGSLFGGGNDKQRFGFATGPNGLQTPFGGLAVTQADGVDANSIIKGLAGIDETLADLLSPGQIARVRGDLAGTGQNFNVHSFDNEGFDVVKTRLTRIIDSVAENSIASGLLDAIDRDPGNIDELVNSAQEIIVALNAFGDEGESLNDAELAIKALSESMDDMEEVAGKLGLAFDRAAKEAEGLQTLRSDFGASIADQILAIEDPLALKLQQQAEVAAARIENAIALELELGEVQRLNALERQQIIEQSTPGQDFTSANSSIASFLKSLDTSAAGGLTVAQRATNTEGQFNTLLGAARSDPAARADLAALLPGFLDLKREQLGSTAEFFEFRSFLSSTLSNLVDQGDTVTTLKDVGAAITRGDNEVVFTLNDQLGGLRQEFVELKDDLALLLARQTA